MEETVIDETETPAATKRSPGRPKGWRRPTPVAPVATAPSAGVALTAEQFMALMQQQAEILRANKQIDIEVAAEVNAKAMKKALRPENEVAPGISVYNPKGILGTYVRPTPTHIFQQGPYPICSPQDSATVTNTEIELCNQLRPGDYMVTKADGQDVKVTVRTEFESNGLKPYRTTILMPMADDDQKANWVPLVQMLTQILTGEPPQASYARYQAIIDKQAAEIAALKAAPAA